MFRNPSWPILSQMMILLMMPLLLWSQTHEDSLEVNYDSIQDVRTNLLERRIDRRLDQIEGGQLKNIESLDSMGLILKDLRNHIEHLEQDKIVQSERLSLLQNEMEHSRKSSHEYRKGLQRILWLTGSAMLILLVGTFLFLLLFSMKTRSLMYRLKWKQKRFGSEIKRILKEQQKTLQSQERKLGEKSKIQKRTLRKRIRKELQKLLKSYNFNSKRNKS